MDIFNKKKVKELKVKLNDKEENIKRLRSNRDLLLKNIEVLTIEITSFPEISKSIIEKSIHQSVIDEFGEQILDQIKEEGILEILEDIKQKIKVKKEFEHNIHNFTFKIKTI